MNRWIVYVLVLLAAFATPLHAQIPPSLAALDGKATDVGLGANGVLWAIGTEPVPGGRTIHRWNGTTWDRIPGGAVRVAVDPQGAAWVVNDAKAIFRWTGTTWETVPGDAIDVGIGADGTVWVLNGAGTPHRFANGSWTAIEGRGASIAVGPKGGPWIVGANGEVFHYNLDKKAWTPLPGQAKDISVAADGTAYMVGSPGGKLFRLDATQWTVVEAAAAGERITAGPLGTIVIARASNAEPALLRAGRIAAAPVAVAPLPPAAAPAPAAPSVATPSLVLPPEVGKIPLIQPPPASSWSTLSGSVTDVGIGANGTLWAIGGNTVPGGKNILRWTGNAWETVPGGAVRIAVDPTGNPWVTNDRGTIFRRKGADWEAMPGAASDVGIGADGTVWVIGSGGTPYRWDGTAWKAISGGGTSIAVGPKGEPWVVNAAGSIWRYPMPSGPWELVPGKGQDIAVAADGAAYVVGTGAGTVSVLRGTTWVADPSAAGTRIAAGPAGTLAVVKAGAPLVAGTIAAPGATAAAPSLALPPEVGKISLIQPPPVAPAPAPSGTASAGQAITITQTGQSIPVDPNAPPPSVAPTRGDQNLQVTGGPSSIPWSTLSGNVTDVGIGANGTLWAIGGNTVPGGKQILRWTGAAWETIPGGAVRIAVDPTGNPWVTNDRGTIFRRKGSDWEAMPGSASDVGIGADGTVWVIGGGGTPHRWDGSAWKAISGGGTSIAVGPKGEPWVVNAAGSIWRHTMPSGPWQFLPGKAQDIGVAADGTAYIVGAGTGTVSVLRGTTWVADPSAAGARIAAGPAGTVVVAKDAASGAGLLAAGTITGPSVPVSINVPVITSPGTTISIDNSGTGSIAVNPGSTPTQQTAPGYTAPVVQNTAPGSGPTASGALPSLPAALKPYAGYVPHPSIIPGRLLCSEGVEFNGLPCGKVEPLDLGPYRVAVPTDCPSGSFWDAYFGGTCWKCDGDRTTEEIDGEDACAKEVLYRATKVSSAVTAFTCPAQTFWDGYNGGACYNCGDGNRTAYHIDSDKACSRIQRAPATFVKNVGCTDHDSWEIGAPRPYPDVTKGKCYACPILDEVTGDVVISEQSVWAGEDCRVRLRWKPTQVKGRRISGQDVEGALSGSGALVGEMLAHPERITAYLKFRAQEVGKTTSEVPAFIEAHWADIAKNPNEHPIIKAMLLNQAIKALAKPAGGRTMPEQQMLNGFRDYIQAKREAVPSDALEMYRNWKHSVDVMRSTRKPNAGDFLYYCTPPLDFDVAAQVVTVGGSIALGSAGVSGSVAAFESTVAVVKSSTGIEYFNSLNSSLRAVQAMIRAGSTAEDAITAGKTVSAAGKVLIQSSSKAITTAGAVAAGAAIITIAFGLLLDVAIDQIVACEMAEPMLEAKLKGAQAPVSLEATLQREGGPAQLALLWGSMLEEQIGPDVWLQPQAASAAAAAKAAGYPTVAAATPITTVPPPTIPGMSRPEAIQILSLDLARRQVTARARGGAELVTVTSPNTAVFATLRIGGRAWVDRASLKASLDGVTACCTATIAEGPLR